ncbi:hypothetical protein SFC52_18855 [Niallia circulans]|uniref:hypothetical protein n=1 Tax=Niallia circulans TaxID=1397 RepID=UPI00397850EE
MQKYQPKGGGNQPKCKNISQKEEEISQSAKISAKRRGKSAKDQKYQPKGGGNQPKTKNISQKERGISQSAEISAYRPQISTKIKFLLQIP